MRGLSLAMGLGVFVGSVVGCDAKDTGSDVDDPTTDRFGMACPESMEIRECGNADEDELRAGEQYCFQHGANLMWGECVVEAACDPLNDDPCWHGGPSCVLDGDGAPQLASCMSPEPDAASEPEPDPEPEPEPDPGGGDDEGDTPLVLALDDAPVVFRMAAEAAFDISGAGQCDSHDWPTAQTPWLAIDLDGNGQIDAGNELFGSGTILGSGMKADNGFAALAELDSDGDGEVTEADARWAELVAWSDHDGDKRTDAGELEPLSAYGLVALPLAYERRAECDERRNCAIEQAALQHTVDGVQRTGRLVDVHLPCR